MLLFCEWFSVHLGMRQIREEKDFVEFLSNERSGIEATQVWFSGSGCFRASLCRAFMTRQLAPFSKNTKSRK